MSVFVIIHYLVFEPFFRSVGLYYSFGPWRGGLDKGSAVYLLLLGLGLYVLLRARAPKLAAGKLETFEVLVSKLLLTRRYDELFALIEPHLFKLFELSNPRAPCFWKTWGSGGRLRFCSAFTKLRAKLLAKSGHADRARDILKSILNQPQFVAYLSVSHPHFCLKILAVHEVVLEDFTELFVAALINDSNSLLYSELKNNQNLNGRHRLALPTSNRILHFLFYDVTTAERLALYQSIGETVCRRIDEDPKLAEAYNLPMGYYNESGKFRCPIHAGIKLFEIMIHEAIHQGIQDHLWLFYFTHFTDKILKQLRDQEPTDSHHEWPTPFHFLLYEIVTITSDWVEDFIDVKSGSIAEHLRNQQDFDSQYISKQAADALGRIVQSILVSPKIDDRFKGYVLEISLERYKRFQNRKDANTVAHAFINAMIFGDAYTTKKVYRRELHRAFQDLDHVLRRDVESFGLALERSLDD
ncbi:hypothetical protein [Pseudomonas fluorescens]|nr:hypothetical protein [Pseudomonas fluorescens]